MSLTGETKNTTHLSNDMFVKVWPSFEMSDLYMLQKVCIWPKNTSKPITPVVLGLWISFTQCEEGDGGRGGKGVLHSPSSSYTLQKLREHCLAEK